MNLSPLSLLVKQPASALAEALDKGLRAAGITVVVPPTPYHAVVEASRAGALMTHLIVGVDFFGRDQFRVIAVARRQWPAARVVAYYSPGFEQKAHVAELLGADTLLGSTDDVARFLASLTPAAGAAAPPPTAKTESPGKSESPAAEATGTTPLSQQPLRAEKEAVSAPASLPPDLAAAIADEPVPVEPVPTPAALTSASSSKTAAPASGIRGHERPAGGPAETPRSAQPAVRPSRQADDEDILIDGEIVGTIELTEEELRVLLGEDEQPEQESTRG